ncbi:MAG: T9SS type A sorting domain-containing protein [Bacteroidia bacterium]|nr:T9SS type A sorting domain-containing protein [Bacteroidia bacterium]
MKFSSTRLEPRNRLWTATTLLLLVLVTSTLSAQTTPQYSTPANSSGSNSFPLNSSTNKIQLQYQAGEFSGAYNGLITRVYLQRSATTTSQSTFTNLTISLAQSATWPTATTGYYTPVTLCYTATTTIFPAGSADQWIGITLNTPFAYDPTQHLIVIVCQEGYSTGISLRNVSTAPAPRRIWATGGCSASTPTGNGSERYNFGFDLISPGPMDYASSTTTQNNTTPVGTGTNNAEIIGVPIVVTGSTSPISATSFTFNTTGSTSTANMTAARVFYTGSNPSFAATSQFGTTVTNPSGSFTVNGTQVLGPGTNYFWLAYDIAVNATVSHVVDAQCTGLTVGGIPRVPTVTNPAGSRSIIEMLNGIYTINPTGSGNRNFTTFNNAVAAMLAAGISGPVTFNVAASTYTEQVSIPAIPGASSTNTITFDGGAGNASTRILQYSTPNSYDRVVLLDGADYLRIRNLTIRATGTTYGYGVLFTNSADNNEITNCNIEVYNGGSSTNHIAVLASTTTSYSTYGAHGSNNLLEDNNIIGGYYGIRWNGSSSSDYLVSSGNQFINNTITDWYYYGMYMYYSGSITVKRNRSIQRTTGTFTTSSGYAYYIYYPNNGPEISYNYGFAAYSPLYVYRPNYYYASTNNRARVYNNMGATNGTSTNYGLYVSYPRYTDCVYNSVFCKTTGTTYGLYVYGEATAYDNKYANNWVVLEGSGTFYAQYHMTSGSAVSYSLFDNNAFYRIGTGTTSYYWEGTSYTSLAAMQAVSTGFNQNTVYGDPYFASATDLHSSSDVGYQAGVAVSGYTDDFDGDQRGPSPCIGADEYPQPPPQYDVAVDDVRLNYADMNWARIEGGAAHTVDVVLESVGREAAPNGISITYKMGSMPTSEFDGVQQTFNPTWNNRKAVVSFNQKVTGLVPSAGQTVYVKVFWAADGDVTDNTGSDTRRIDNTKIHGRENFDSMLAPNFSDDPGFLDYDWTVYNSAGPTVWSVANGVGSAGSNAVSYPGDTQVADDWFFTPGADLQAGSSYRIAFNMKSVSGAPQRVEVAYGMSPDPGSMTTFATFANFTNTGFMTAKQIAGGLDPYFNTPNQPGVYFIGFHVTSNAGAGAVVIDDIVLDDNPSPPPKIAFGIPGDPVNTFINDPGKKLQFTATYKVPGLINRTYEVASSTNIYGANGDFLWDVETNTPWITLTKATPEPTMQGYNFTPPRPRQFQDFTLTINPNGLAPGLHVGQITFYGFLFNDDFPPPNNGLVATNEPLNIDVELRVVNSGTKGGTQYEEATLSSLSSGNTYNFTATGTGNPIATVEVTGGSIAGMTIRVYPYQLPQNLARMLYVKRYWQITTTGGGWWTANITFPYADQEAVMIADRNQLHGVRQAVALGQWEDPIMGTSSASDPGNNLVTVFDLNPTNSTGNIALAQSYMMGKPGDALPTVFGLEQNYPNPFNPSTTVSFTVAEERPVRIVVYNGLGMEVGELINDILPAGRYAVDFDASGLPSGTYVYRMMAGDFVQSHQMVLSK